MKSTISYQGLAGGTIPIEIRAIGRFTADQVRELDPKMAIPLFLGCPPAILESIMERNLANRKARAAGQPIPVVAAPTRQPAPVRQKFVPTEAQRQEVLDRVRKIRLANSAARIAASERQLDALPVPTVTLTDEQRRKHAEEVAAKIYADNVADWQKAKQWS